MEGRLAALLGRAAGRLEDTGLRPLFSQKLRQLRLRLDEDALPPELFQVPGLRAVKRVVGAHLDEEPLASLVEKTPDQCPFLDMDVISHA